MGKGCVDAPRQWAAARGWPVRRRGLCQALGADTKTAADAKPRSESVCHLHSSNGAERVAEEGERHASVERWAKSFDHAVYESLEARAMWFSVARSAARWLHSDFKLCRQLPVSETPMRSRQHAERVSGEGARQTCRQAC